MNNCETFFGRHLLLFVSSFSWGRIRQHSGISLNWLHQLDHLSSFGDISPAISSLNNAMLVVRV